ncbi:MAG: response regulator [Ignavibacteriales bacterium]|nr:response regulator [Ignavibacteriales bacterium]
MKSNRPLYVLIVDDEDSFRKTLSATLLKGGLDVEECNSGEGALYALKQNRFDVIVLDFKMDGMSGLSVLQWMNEQKIETPVIMLSGAGSDNIAIEAIKFGAYDYIRKDLFDQQHFPIVVRGVHERYLYRREKERESYLDRGREKDVMSLQLLRDTSSFLSHQVNTVLADISTELVESESQITSSLQDNAKKLIEKTFLGVKQRLNLIAVMTKSLVDLSRLLYDQFQGTQDTQDAENVLRQQVKSLQESFKSSQ